jgi:hypothetical protein
MRNKQKNLFRSVGKIVMKHPELSYQLFALCSMFTPWNFAFANPYQGIPPGLFALCYKVLPSMTGLSLPRGSGRLYWGAFAVQLLKQLTRRFAIQGKWTNERY